jgi:hypothetical protein
MSPMTTIEPLPEKLSPDEKRQRRRYISEARGAIERGDKAYAELGAALWALQDEALYRDGGLTFPEFVLAEFGISKSNAYRCIEIAKAVQAHPELPIPSRYAIEQARPKASDRPKVGTVGGRQSPSDLPVPEVVDAEWSEEVEPKALPEDNGDTDPATLRPADWQAITENVSAHARAVEDVTPDVGSVVPNQRREDQGEDSDTAAPFMRLHEGATVVDPEPILTPPTHARLQEAIYEWLDAHGIDRDPGEGMAWSAEGWTDGKWETVYPSPIPPVPGFPIQRPSALILLDLLTSADLDAIGTEMTANQMDTLTRAYEQIRESWTVTHKARKDWSKELRARRPVGNAPVAARSAAPLGRREVTPMFKQGKEKVAR